MERWEAIFKLIMIAIIFIILVLAVIGISVYNSKVGDILGKIVIILFSLWFVVAVIFIFITTKNDGLMEMIKIAIGGIM